MSAEFGDAPAPAPGPRRPRQRPQRARDEVAREERPYPAQRGPFEAVLGGEGTGAEASSLATAATTAADPRTRAAAGSARARRRPKYQPAASQASRAGESTPRSARRWRQTAASTMAPARPRSGESTSRRASCPAAKPSSQRSGTRRYTTFMSGSSSARPRTRRPPRYAAMRAWSHEPSQAPRVLDSTSNGFAKRPGRKSWSVSSAPLTRRAAPRAGQWPVPAEARVAIRKRNPRGGRAARWPPGRPGPPATRHAPRRDARSGTAPA